jgi:hypothetical protein
MKSANGDGFKFEPSVYFHSASGNSFGLAVFLRVGESADIEKVRHEFVKRLTDSFRQKDIKLASTEGPCLLRLSQLLPMEDFSGQRRPEVEIVGDEQGLLGGIKLWENHKQH